MDENNTFDDELTVNHNQGANDMVNTNSDQGIEKKSAEIGRDLTSNVPKENSDENLESECNIDFLLDIPLEITIELDRTTLLVNELLKLGQGSVIELSKFAGETLDVLANQRLIAKGEVVVINDKYGIRLTEVISPMERLVRLK